MLESGLDDQFRADSSTSELVFTVADNTETPRSAEVRYDAQPQGGFQQDVWYHVQLFATGCLQSAYWHRFALTVHAFGETVRPFRLYDDDGRTFDHERGDWFEGSVDREPHFRTGLAYSLESFAPVCQVASSPVNERMVWTARWCPSSSWKKRACPAGAASPSDATIGPHIADLVGIIAMTDIILGDVDR